MPRVPRWTDRPWQYGGDEDSVICQQAGQHGQIARLNRTVANNMAFCRYHDYPAYYDRTAAVRGIDDAEHSV